MAGFEGMDVRQIIQDCRQLRLRHVLDVGIERTHLALLELHAIHVEMDLVVSSDRIRALSVLEAFARNEVSADAAGLGVELVILAGLLEVRGSHVLGGAVLADRLEEVHATWDEDDASRVSHRETELDGLLGDQFAHSAAVSSSDVLQCHMVADREAIVVDGVVSVLVEIRGSRFEDRPGIPRFSERLEDSFVLLSVGVARRGERGDLGDVFGHDRHVVLLVVACFCKYHNNTSASAARRETTRGQSYQNGGEYRRIMLRDDLVQNDRLRDQSPAEDPT